MNTHMHYRTIVFNSQHVKWPCQTMHVGCCVLQCMHELSLHGIRRCKLQKRSLYSLHALAAGPAEW